MVSALESSLLSSDMILAGESMKATHIKLGCSDKGSWDGYQGGQAEVLAIGGEGKVTDNI
jgi:hypothetical protein